MTIGTELMGNKLSHLGHFPFSKLRLESVTDPRTGASQWLVVVYILSDNKLTHQTSVNISGCWSVTKYLPDLFHFQTSVPNHFDTWFDSFKTRGKLAPTFPGVSGGLVGGVIQL